MLNTFTHTHTHTGKQFSYLIHHVFWYLSYIYRRPNIALAKLVSSIFSACTPITRRHGDGGGGGGGGGGVNGLDTLKVADSLQFSRDTSSNLASLQ